MTGAGTFNWLAQHELRLSWRDWIALMTGGRRKRARRAVIVLAVFAVIMGTVTSFFFGLPIGLVLGAAMVFNMIWAGIAGTLIPLTLARFGIDPAIGAGPFLTTTTDVFGFFSFLGLATLFLL